MPSMTAPANAPEAETTASPLLPNAFASRLPLLFVRAGNDLTIKAEARFQALGIDGRAYIALAILADDQPGSQLELAQACGKAPAMVVNMVDDLTDKGFVVRERDPKDRRRSIVTLTDAGRAVLADADREAERVQDEMFGTLSAQERTMLHTLMRRALSTVPAAEFRGE
jgi:DNA-binding MarR family transcriptional regulator